LVELVDEETGVAQIEGIDDCHHGPPAMSVDRKPSQSRQAHLFTIPFAAKLSTFTTDDGLHPFLASFLRFRYHKLDSIGQCGF
jgi:hypothetical protein